MKIHLFRDIVLYKGKFYTEKSNIKQCKIKNNKDFVWQPEDISKISNVIENNDLLLNTEINVLIEGFTSNMGHLLWDCMYPSW